MHELSITRNVVAIACERAGARRVRAVHLRIGALAGIDIPAVRYCYDLCTSGTVAAGSELVIEEVTGAAKCTECGVEQIVHDLRLRCPCPRGAPLERTAGEELLITTLEVDDV